MQVIIRWSGAPLLQVVEPQSLTKKQYKGLFVECKSLNLQKKYNVRWFRAKTDLSLLAIERWVNETSIEKMEEIFGLSHITISQHLRNIKRDNKLTTLSLTESQRAKIQSNWKKEG